MCCVGALWACGVPLTRCDNVTVELPIRDTAERTVILTTAAATARLVQCEGGVLPSFWHKQLAAGRATALSRIRLTNSAGSPSRFAAEY